MLQFLTDPGTADFPAVIAGFFYYLHLKTAFLLHVLQKPVTALPVMAEMKIRPHSQIFYMQPLYQNLPHKILCLHMGYGFHKGALYQIVHAPFFQEISPLLREQKGGPFSEIKGKNQSL